MGDRSELWSVIECESDKCGFVVLKEAFEKGRESPANQTLCISPSK